MELKVNHHNKEPYRLLSIHIGVTYFKFLNRNRVFWRVGVALEQTTRTSNEEGLGTLHGE